MNLNIVEKIFLAAVIVAVLIITPPAIMAFTGRAQVAEADTMAKPVQRAVTEYLKSQGRCPAPELMDTLELAKAGEFVHRLSLKSGCVIEVVIRDDAREKIAGKKLIWYAGVSASGDIFWNCGTATAINLGNDPLIAYSAASSDNTLDYDPWLPTRCHPPRPLSERKPSVVLFFERLL
ncbi:MAG: pilin [bacterium]